jgi:hypothetical protein
VQTVGKHFNQQTWREHEQQSRRQHREDDDQREQQYDEWLPERLGDEVELMDGGW